MADIEFYSAKPGDVCNRNGDIRYEADRFGSDIIGFGLMVVNPAQARLAGRYGWQIVETESDRVTIER